MLKNAYFLAKIGADTAENEQYFAEILPKTGWTCDVYRKDEIDRSARGGVAPGCKKRCTTVGGIVFENIAEQMEQNEY